MAESVIKDYFPSQVASDSEKVTKEYGLKVGKAIEDEWFKRDDSSYRFASHQSSFRFRIKTIHGSSCLISHVSSCYHLTCPDKPTN